MTRRTRFSCFHFGGLVWLVASSLAAAAEPERLPDGIPPLTGEAVVKHGDGAESTISVTLRRDTWREIRAVLPRLEWPEPTWEQIPGTQEREGTMTLPLRGDAESPFCRVVGMDGSPVGGDELVEQLEIKQPVLVSASGLMPHPCYLRLPTSARLIVLLGPGEEDEADEAPLDEKAADAAERDAEREDELENWGEDQSQQYYFQLMQGAAAFNIETEEAAAEYLRGIWRLDRRAHVGGGHYVRSDRGDDVTLICTDEWLVTSIFEASADVRIEEVKRFETIEVTGNRTLSVDSGSQFMPLGEDHVAFVKYDFIAVLKRVPCESEAESE